MRMALVILGSYLLGSLNVAGLAGLVSGRDPRRWGSGHLGAWNAGRRLGLGIGLLVFVGDAAKGAAAVWLAGRFLAGPFVPPAAGLAVTAGHVWPLWFHFRGGKGLSTSLGVLAVLNLRWLLAPLALAVLILGITRNIYAAALASIVVLPLGQYLSGASPVELAFGCALSALLLFTHRANIRDIVRTHAP